MRATKRYEVLFNGNWQQTKEATEARKGYLDFRLLDGTAGIAKPEQWRSFRVVKMKGRPVCAR